MLPCPILPKVTPRPRMKWLGCALQPQGRQTAGLGGRCCLAGVGVPASGPGRAGPPGRSSTRRRAPALPELDKAPVLQTLTPSLSDQGYFGG